MRSIFSYQGLFSLVAALSLSTLQAGEWQTWFADGKMDDFVVAGGSATYKIENGVLIGTTTEASPNTFLLSKPFKDFELEFEVNVDNELNSGVQVRSRVKKDGNENLSQEEIRTAGGGGRVYGPQCEIAVNGSAGDFYDEGRHGKWWQEIQTGKVTRSPEATAAFKKNEWNKYRVVVKGNHYQSWVNGVKTADFKQDNDPEGGIGFQVHGIKKGTGPYSVRWKNVRIKELK